MKNFKPIFNCSLCFLVLLLLYFISAVLSLILHIHGKYLEIIGCIDVFFTIIFCIWILKLNKRKSFIKWDYKNIQIKNMLFLILIVVSYYIFTTYMLYITKLNQYFKTPSVDVEFMINSPFIATLFLFIIDPILVEVLFRGIFFNELKRISPIIVALIIQAIFFGFIYGTFFNAFLNGVLLAIIYFMVKNNMGSNNSEYNFENNWLFKINNIYY